MVGDTLCDRELASLSSLSRNNLFLISPCFGGKQLHSKLNVGWHQTPTIILFPNTVIISTATVSKTTQDPSSARLVLLFHHCPRAWTGSLAPLYRTYSKILNPATGFVFGLHSRYALGRSNSSSKAPATFSFLFFFCLKDFYFNHAVPIPRTIRGQYSPVYRKCRATECCFGKLQWSLV